MSETNRVKLIYVPESSYGATPESGTWETVRFTGESLGAKPSTVISDEIRSDRQVSDLVLVNTTIEGGINIELSYGTFDTLLEAALCGTWTSDVLKAGTVARSFTVSKQFEDLESEASPFAKNWIHFTGMRVGQMSLAFQFGQIVTGSFQFAGNGATTDETSLVGAGSVTPATTTSVLSSADFSTLKIDGTPATQYISQINLTLNNNLRPINALGYVAPINQAYGRSLLNGQVTAYFSDFEFYDHVLANSELELEWTVSDGTNSYIFNFPKIKIGDGTPVAEGIDRDVMPQYSFTALYDETDATQITVTRIAG